MSRHGGDGGGIPAGLLQGLVQPFSMVLHEGTVHAPCAMQPGKEATEQDAVRTGPQGQVQIGGLAGGGGPGVHHHHPQVGIVLLRGHDAPVKHRMAPRGVGAHQHDEFRLLEVLVTAGHGVAAEGPAVAGHRGGHAQPRVGVDVGGAHEALHELVGDVVVLGEQLPRDVEGHGIGAMGINDAPETIRHGIEGAFPGHRDARHLRRIQAPVVPHGLGEGRSFGAQPAAIGGMVRVAPDLPARRAIAGHQQATADAAVRAGGAYVGHGPWAVRRPSGRPSG